MAPEFSAPHTQLTFGGTAWGGAETWSFGVKVAEGGAPLDVEAMDWVVQAGVDYMVNPSAKFCSSAQLEWVKAALVTVEGTYPPGVAAVLRELDEPVLGGDGGTTYPQVALAVTMLSDIPRGPASHGRFYPPPTCHVATGDGRISEAYQGGYLQAALDFIEQLNNGTTGPVRLFAKHETAPASANVTKLRVGRVFDTQRRRRSQLDEDYMESPVEP